MKNSVENLIVGCTKTLSSWGRLLSRAKISSKILANCQQGRKPSNVDAKMTLNVNQRYVDAKMTLNVNQRYVDPKRSVACTHFVLGSVVDLSRNAQPPLMMHTPHSSYGMDAAGHSHGSVFGAWRPWCPPGFIQYIRENFPNGIDNIRTNGGRQQTCEAFRCQVSHHEMTLRLSLSS